MNDSQKMQVLVDLDSDHVQSIVANHTTQMEFESTFLLRLREMIEDLGLAQEFSVDLHLVETKKLPPASRFRVRIALQTCRGRVQGQKTDLLKPRQLANVIAEDVFENRELFLSQSVTEGFWRRLPRVETMPTPSNLREVFDRFLILLVRQGLNIREHIYIFESIANAKVLDAEGVEDLMESWVGTVSHDELTVRLSPEFYDQMNHAGVAEITGVADGRINQNVKLMLNGLFYDLGVKFPPVRFSRDETLTDREFRLSFNGLKWPIRTILAEKEILVDMTPEQLALVGVTARSAINPYNGSECALINEDESDQAKHIPQGVVTWDAFGYLCLLLGAELRSHVSLFVKTSTIDEVLGRLIEAYPMPVFNSIECFGTNRVTQVMQKLAEEVVSIRDLRTILGAMLEINGTMAVDLDQFDVCLPTEARLVVRLDDKESRPIGTSEYVDYIRIQLRNQICQAIALNCKDLFVYRLSDRVEKRLMQANAHLLSDKERERLINALFNQIGARRGVSVVLTRMSIRRLFKNLTKKEFPDLRVLCHEEVSPYVTVTEVGRIDWN